MVKENQRNNVSPCSQFGTKTEFDKLEICPEQDQSLADLNKYLSNKSFILGWGLTVSDESVYAKCSNDIDAVMYPHVARWCSFIGSFSPTTRKSWTGEEVDVYDLDDDDSEEDENESKKDKEKGNDDDDDDSSDDMDFDNLDTCDAEDDEETKKLMAKHADKIKEIHARQAAKAGKAKTNITIDINPEDENTDMEELQERVTAIEIEGLKWFGHGSIVPTCYGMSKITIMCQIVDVKVPSTQIIYDTIEELEGVGSTREIACQMA